MSAHCTMPEASESAAEAPMASRRASGGAGATARCSQRITRNPAIAPVVLATMSPVSASRPGITNRCRSSIDVERASPASATRRPSDRTRARPMPSGTKRPTLRMKSATPVSPQGRQTSKWSVIVAPPATSVRRSMTASASAVVAMPSAFCCVSATVLNDVDVGRGRRSGV